MPSRFLVSNISVGNQLVTSFFSPIFMAQQWLGNTFSSPGGSVFDQIYRHGSRGGAGCMAPGPHKTKGKTKWNEVNGGGGFTLW